MSAESHVSGVGSDWSVTEQIRNSWSAKIFSLMGTMPYTRNLDIIFWGVNAMWYALAAHPETS